VEPGCWGGLQGEGYLVAESHSMVVWFLGSIRLVG